MEALTEEAWAALRAEGEPATQESAAGRPAQARERLLAHYRNAVLERGRLDPTAAGEDGDAPWNDAEIAAWDWIETLANAGHAGARNLRLRIMDCARALDVLARRDPGRLETLALLSTPAALARARLACAGEKPDLDEVLQWLSAAKAYDSSRNNFEKVIAALRHAGGPRRVDFGAIRKLLQPAAYAELKYSTHDSAALMAMVEARRASADPQDRAAAAPLLIMAAWLGSDAARDELIAAGDPAVVLHWLNDERRAAVGDAINQLRALETRIGPEEMLVFRNACYLGLAGGPGAVPEHGNEPYAARLFYVLAHLKLRQADAQEQAAGSRLLDEAARRGSRRAQLERYRADGRLDDLLKAIEAGNEPQLATAIRELQAIAGVPSEADLDALGQSIQRKYTAGGILHALARRRLLSANAEDQAKGTQLLRRAAELGSVAAVAEIADAQFAAANDKRAFVEGYLARLPKGHLLIARFCLRLGAAIERGEAGAPPDLRAALDWYARALERTVPQAGEHDQEFCYAIATAFDMRWRVHRIDDSALALDWHERGMLAGYQRCRQAWFDGCVKDFPEYAADPAAVRARVQRMLEVRPGPDARTRHELQQMFVERAKQDLRTAAFRAGSEVEHEFWRAIKDFDDKDDFELYLQQFPNGTYAALARRKLAGLPIGEDLQPDVPAPPAATTTSTPWLEIAALLGSDEAARMLRGTEK